MATPSGGVLALLVVPCDDGSTLRSRMVDTPKYPHFGFFPALPLAKNIELRDWIIGTPPKDVAWRSDRFKLLSETLVASFEKTGFRNAALLWHRERGFDGTRPSDDEIGAIQAAIRFTVLDANDHIFGDINAGHFLATAENTELFLQPIVEEDGSITHRKEGFLRRVQVLGYKIGQEAIPLPDATVSIQRPMLVSRKLAAALFRALTATSTQTGRIRIALEWHTIAMSNPIAVTLQQRLIAIKTAFEALLGTSDSRECARRLRALFESVTKPHLHLLPWAGMLWSPKERTDLVRQYTKKGVIKTDTRSELEDWFMRLAAARNSVIHNGVLSITDYPAPLERPLSRYKGTLFSTGERLLREAIKASLGAQALLCARLEEEASWAELNKSLLEQYPELANPAGTAKTAEDETAKPAQATAVPTRTVAEILLALGCKAANEIEMESVTGAPSASDEVAHENAQSARDKWSASVGEKSLLITEEEHAQLEAAGAEDKLPDHFHICD